MRILASLFALTLLTSAPPLAHAEEKLTDKIAIIDYTAALSMTKDGTKAADAHQAALAAARTEQDAEIAAISHAASPAEQQTRMATASQHYLDKVQHAEASFAAAIERISAKIDAAIESYAAQEGFVLVVRKDAVAFASSKFANITGTIVHDVDAASAKPTKPAH